MLSNAELLQMREAIAQLFPDTCNVLSVSESPDGFGGVSQTWGTIGTAVPCRLDFVDRLGQSERIAGAGIKAFQETILSMPYDTTITEAHRIEHDSYTYNVRMANNDQSRIAVRRLRLERV